MPNSKKPASSKGSRKTELVSSPASTGGAGNVFEHAVGAYLLSQLLVGATPPVLIDCTVVEVSFQNEYRGWKTDDFLLVGKTTSGVRRKLAGQVKRHFTVSSIDADFKKSILDFWSDLQNSAIFASEHDRLAFVVQYGTNTLLRHFGSLLDCARASRDAEDFEKRLSTPGLLNSKAIDYCDEVVTILKEAGNANLTRADAFPLLKVLHILTLDLATATRQTEASIKSILSFTATTDPKADTAAHTWNGLIVLAAEGATEAKEFRKDDLPIEMVQQHSTCNAEEPIIVALRDHSSVITRGIRPTIGCDLHLERASLVQAVLTALESSRIVLLSGAAGNGKSAIAKQIMSLLGRDHFTFAFRAEEFAQPHFDTTLTMANIGGRAETLATILASQQRKIIFVESLERLLEKSTRDAFADLLTIIRDDPTYRLVLTCRDYSADLVRSAFLDQFRNDYESVTVPPLSEDELDQVMNEDVRLTIPLSSAHLRPILSNPYVLDKARAIDWSTEATLPVNEREFRELFWRDIVRVDHRLGTGMPAKRDAAFIEIALRRARALSVFASSANLDPDALAGLISDSLVVRADNNWDLVAPTHDVLEDWAILRWLDRLYLEVNKELALFQMALGTHPALRRSYRKWMGELLEREPSSGQAIFQEALSGQNLTASFRDDTLVALLQASAAGSLLLEREPELLSNNRQNLKRVIHLVRLACVATPAWAQGNVGGFAVPRGPVWPALLSVVRRAWATYDSETSLLVLGLVEDWAKGISANEPYPPGFEDAAAIAYTLLESFDDYSHDKELKRTIRIVSKIPNSNPTRYQEFLSTPRQKGRDRSRIAEELQEILFCGAFYESLPTARDLSSALISGIRTNIVCTDEDLEEELEWPSSLDIELYFGLRRRVAHHYFPASAYRTPMMPLLREHPRPAIEFLLELFNHVADWYVHPRIADRLEPTFEVTVKLPDGSTKTHWSNSRLWQLYRGTSVGPYVLQSYLMALERWLRQLAKSQATLLDTILIELLSRTDNASIAGVVAAVATAFPFQASETLLALLSAREYVLLDKQRMVADLSPASQLLQGMMGRRDADHQIFDDERSEADKWPSRKDDIEGAVRNLQITKFASRVQARLDELRDALGPVETQGDDDRFWRLALHRMDLRGYQVAEETALPEEARKEGIVLLQARDPEPDIQELLARTAPRMQEQQQRMGLVTWAFKAFKRELTDAEAASWRVRLEQARAQLNTTDQDEMAEFWNGGPEIMAALCARDHWEDLSPDEKDWCVNQIAHCIGEHANDWNHHARLQRFEMAPNRSCAYATVILSAKQLTEEQKALVHDALPIALTYPVDEVRWYATLAVTELWDRDPDIATRCVFAMAKEANVLLDLTAREEKKRYDQRHYENVYSEAANAVRASFWEPDTLDETEYDTLGVEEWHGAEAQNKILFILKAAPQHPLAAKAFSRAARALSTSWDSKHKYDSNRERNIEADITLADLIEQFSLDTSSSTATQALEPILEAIDRHPDEADDILLGILHVEDRDPHPAQFWAIWQLFADRAKTASWIGNIDRRHSHGANMIHALFLGTQWKETTRHWRSLEGHAHKIHHLFDELNRSACVMDAYIRFLYHVGEQSLPDAFVRIHQKSKDSDPTVLFGNSNTRYMMEILLQRFVYSKPLLLKGRTDLREAVLFLLDTLIDLGSSSAFRMRDDFVTPISD
ncbi:MAG: AAA family ATPase [Acidobacteriota bacterium]